MHSGALEPIVFGVVGLVLVILGYLIRVKRRYDLIAGFDGANAAAPEAIGSLVGRTLFMAASVLWAVAILHLVLPHDRAAIQLFLLGGLGAVVVTLITGRRRLMK